jgi:kynurenine formamidase
VPSKAELEEYLRTTRNWGRWGADDQLGTLNLITAAKRIEAAALVRSGRVVSLAREFPKVAGPGNPRPALHFMMKSSKEEDGGGGVAKDFYGVDYHGTNSTHLDALGHVWDADGLYNGRQDDVITFDGATFGAIDQWSAGIITRGVLFDVPKFRKEPFVTIDKPVHAWELDDIAKAQNIEVRPGDAVVVYSGREAHNRANPKAPWSSEPSRPGLDATCVRFLREHDAGALIWDMTDRRPNGYGTPFGVHSAIFAHGLALIDSALLEPLAAVCAEERRNEFMVVVSPLKVVGGTGSPVNPLAVF